MDTATIIYIHEYLTDFFYDKEDPISPPGVKDLTTIESAAARPFATAGGHDAYPTVFLKAASLFHSIIGNHSFHNGNKTAVPDIPLLPVFRGYEGIGFRKLFGAIA